MATNRKVELGQAFVERLLLHYPEGEERDHMREVLTKNPKVVEDIGAGALRQEDYSRVREQQESWWTQQNQKLSAVDRLVERGVIKPEMLTETGGNGNGGREPVGIITDPNKQAITREEFYREGAGLEKVVLQLNSRLIAIGAKHFAEFGTPLDIEPLVLKSMEEKRDIREIYNESVADARAAKAKEKYDADIRAAEERGAKRREQEMITANGGHQPPYPVGTTAPTPTTLAGLKPAEGDRSKYTLDAAVATLVEEMNKQPAA